MKRKRWSSAALWRWRLAHPFDALRASAPRVLSVDVRLRLLALLRPLRKSRTPVDRDFLIAEFEEELATLPMPERGSPPRASVLIVTFNNLRLTTLCIHSLFKLTERIPFEVIVVDNASTDGTAEWLEQQNGLTLIRNSENRGFPAGANQAAAAATGEFLCFLNNDTVVTPGWLSKLVEHASREDAGLVGASTNAIGNEARVRINYGSLSEMIAAADRLAERERGVVLPLPTLAFFCVALRRSVWASVGVLDERFGIGMFEDDDYCRRIRAAGLSILCARDVFVHHWQLASFNLLENGEYLRIYRENEKKFRLKWRE